MHVTGVSTIPTPSYIPSGKLTWQWKMDLMKMYSLLKMGICHCYVSLPECNDPVISTAFAAVCTWHSSTFFHPSHPTANPPTPASKITSPGNQIWKVANSYWHMGGSLNGGTPKPSILIGFSIINHPFWDTTILGNIHISAYSFKRWAGHGHWVFHLPRLGICHFVSWQSLIYLLCTIYIYIYYVHRLGY